MELDGITSAILARMVETTVCTTPSRVNQRNLTKHNNAQLETVPCIEGRATIGASRADPSITTSEQRRAARAIADGKIGTLRADILETLMRRDLLRYDGQSLTLTDVGRALSAL